MKELLLDEYVVERKLPVNFIQEDLKIFQHELIRTFGPVFVTTLQNAYVLDDLVFKPFKFYIPQSLTHTMGRKEQLKRLRFFFSPGVRYDKCIWITDNWSAGYFHWIMDALPRLIACKHKIDGHKVLLDERYQSYKYILETLDIFGYEYVFYSKKCHVNELLLPDHVSITGNYNLPVFHAIRATMLKNTPATLPYRKIYVSRKNTRFRKLLNEEDYIHLLKKFGFEIHYFEKYSLAEQMQLMQETSHFVGLHGNALTNICFMQANTKVLELRFADDKSNNCFFSLAAATGVDYYYQVGSGTSDDTHIADMVIDLKESEKNLDLLLNPNSFS